MLPKCQFNNVDGINTFDLNDVKSPLNLFDVTVASRNDTGRNRVQQHGVNPTKTLRGGMEIHCEGVLFDDDSGPYVTLRKSLVLALFGDPGAAFDPQQRSDGTLVIRLEGESEDWQTDCIVTAFSAPVRGNYPSLTEYAVTFFSWNPWFIGASSANRYYWS